MKDTLLALLRCPYCGTRLSLVENNALIRRGADIESGVLGCECCAFPIVAGIPVLIADDATRDAMYALEARRHDAALVGLLGLTGDRSDLFSSLIAGGAGTTYRAMLEVLSPDAEGTYFLYRFSDPTFLTAEALVRAVGRHDAAVTGPILDLCGGSGHLTRVLAGLRPADPQAPRTVIADLRFWKLWLATRFTAPDCSAVCCDADAPLPFMRDLFAMVVLADAFPYIWHKRLCADEMMGVARPDGVVVIPHLHSALGENFSAGDTLTPDAYRDLFTPYHPRLFSDSRLLKEILEHRVVDLSCDLSPAELGGEPALTLVAGRRSNLFCRRAVPDTLDVAGQLRVNPLYQVERRDGRSMLTLTFPTPEYEAEFGSCRCYLPDTLTVDADLAGAVDPATLGSRYPELRRRRVLIDVPPHYY